MMKTEKSKDLISRADAIEAVAEEWLSEASAESPYVNDDDMGKYRELAEELFEDVPSASVGQTDCTEFVNWLLEEVMDEDNWELNAVANGEIICRKLKKLGLLEVENGYYIRPSAEAENRLYIMIYADDEPSVKAEKLYQICDEEQNREVTEWLKEYFPSAEPVQGEWLEEDEYGDLWVCDQCGFASDYKSNFCPDCGARMFEGGEDE